MRGLLFIYSFHPTSKYIAIQDTVMQQLTGIFSDAKEQMSESHHIHFLFLTFVLVLWHCFKSFSSKLGIRKSLLSNTSSAFAVVGACCCPPGKWFSMYWNFFYTVCRLDQFDIADGYYLFGLLKEKSHCPKPGWRC